MNNSPFLSNCTADTIREAVAALKAGSLVAFPTETVYGLGADARNPDAVKKVYEVKGRPSDHPLIVHISSKNQLGKWAREIPDYAIELARVFWPGPMTLILKRSEIVKDFITGGQDTVGLRVPSDPIALALIQEFEVISNSGIDIRNLVCDMFAFLDQKISSNEITRKNNYFLNKLQPNNYCFETSSYMAPSFIEKYNDIFDS